MKYADGTRLVCRCIEWGAMQPSYQEHLPCGISLSP